MSAPFIFIEPNQDDPYFNLAAESYFLHDFDENVVFLYVNQPSVVVGKHQNAFDECQVDYCAQNNIKIARRLSGGGTVFHGPGNINFCFIKTGDNAQKLIDFKQHLEPVIAFLRSVGLPAEYSGRNDILVDGFKVSGNAEHVYSKKKRVIHHGTLLFNTNLDSLHNSIAPKPHISFKTHAVKSVRSRVKNIEEWLKPSVTFEHFYKTLANFLQSYFNTEKYTLNSSDLESIQKIVITKFATWDWNLGYSPKFDAIIQTNHGPLQVHVVKGKINSCTIQDASIDAVLGAKFTSETFHKANIPISL